MRPVQFPDDDPTLAIGELLAAGRYHESHHKHLPADLPPEFLGIPKDKLGGSGVRAPGAMQHAYHWLLYFSNVDGRRAWKNCIDRGAVRWAWLQYLPPVAVP